VLPLFPVKHAKPKEFNRIFNEIIEGIKLLFKTILTIFISLMMIKEELLDTISRL